jgi:hypothetical protein
MDFVKTNDRDLLETRSGGGCLLLFGLPFFLAGLLVMSSFLDWLPSENPPPPFYVAIPFGGIFTAVGAALAFGRAGIRVDTRRGTLTEWWGLLVPFSRTKHRLSVFKHVGLTRERRRSRNSSYTVYPVRLYGENDVTVSFGEPRDYLEARRGAEKIAEFIRLPVSDSTSGSSEIRECRNLNESVVERIKRTGEVIEHVPPPDRCRVRRVQNGRETELEIPPPGWTPRFLLMLAGGFVFPAFVCFVFVRPLLEEEIPREGKLLILGFIGVFFILLPIVTISGRAFAGANRRVRVTASPSELNIFEQTGPFKKHTVFPCSELEQLLCLETAGYRGGIVALSDEKKIRFGEHLSREERRFLYSGILESLCN